MICLICRQAELEEGLASIPFERGEFRLLIEQVPAFVCPKCGETIVGEEVAVLLINKAEGIFAQGVRTYVCGY